MDFDKFVLWAFMAIMGGGVGWSATFLARISKSISQLNVSVATVIERTAWHQKELENHDHRITHLEEKRKYR
jgi:hypothetical protein